MKYQGQRFLHFVGIIVTTFLLYLVETCGIYTYSFSQNVVRRQNSGCLWRNGKLSVGNGESYNFQMRHPRCVEYKLKYNVKNI
jgi:hypothetical protein